MADNKTGRLNSIDIMRALGIVIMVAGHVGFGGKFDRYIHSFHMPLFFIISGFLYKAKNDQKIGQLILRKARRLLIPYATYGVINYILWFLIEKRTDEVWYKPLVNMCLFNTKDLPICGALWFLTALFWVEVVYIILDCFLRKNILRIIVVAFVSITFAVIQNYTSVRLPLSIDNGMVCLLFFELGRSLKDGKHHLVDKAMTVKPILALGLAILAFIVNGIFAFINPYVNIKSGWYGYIPLFYINAVIGTCVCLFLAVFLDRTLKVNNTFKKVLVTVGRGSLVFLGFNQVVILLISILIGKVVRGDYSTTSYYLSHIFIFICTLGVLYLILYVFNGIKCKLVNILFGI